jgi:hypothetical protein
VPTAATGGRSIDDPRAVAELAAALQALHVFPALAGPD